MTDGPRRVMLITGVSGEIGAHLAQHFLGAGWTVLGLDKIPPAEGPPGGLVFEQCDLTNAPHAASVLEALTATYGACDVVVNCAGKIANAPLVSLGPEGWNIGDGSLWADVIGSNLTAAFVVTALTVRHMLEARKKGLIVHISSVCAAGNPGQSAYSAAKAGLNGFTLALAKELGPLGIRVVGLAPGYFDTRSTRTHVREAKLTKVIAAVPLKRLGGLDELANAVDFIISNGYVHGTIVELDGGLVI